MRILSTITFILMTSVGLQANVIGPNKDGIYKIDKWGDSKSSKENLIKIPDTSHIRINSNPNPLNKL